MNTVSASQPTAFEFGTKAETLDRLRDGVPGANFCEQIAFTCREWLAGRDAIIDRVLEELPAASFAVRSSRLDEDGLDQSMAGAYTSVIHVPCERESLNAAICEVIESYGSGVLPDDQVLVQPMVAAVAASGVAFSCDIATGAPYVTVNYDDFSGRTDTVTTGGESKLIVVRRGGEASMRSARFRALIDVIYALEAITASNAVDIEFCIDDQDRIFILQVRPLAVQNSMSSDDSIRFHAQLDALESEGEKRLVIPPSLAGSRTVLGEMPDWNPAEMIGTTPTPLAASMYKWLITDRAWSTARARMGYRNVPEPLMVLLEGHPFVDVLRSLNSFLPAGLSQDLATRIVDAQTDHLASHPEYHDKLEFDIAITAWDFALDERLAILRDADLSAGEIDRFKTAVLQHTRTLLSDPTLAPNAVLAQVRDLRPRIAGHQERAGATRGLAILADTVPCGTIPFAILARQAFVAIAMLRSFVANGAMPEADYGAFLRSVHTVTTEFVHHSSELARGALSQEEFLTRYGHLRPGTYDIRVLRYDEAPERYLSGVAPDPLDPSPFEPDTALLGRIDTLLSDSGLEIGADDLFQFARSAIAGRELAKFQFTRGVSEALRAFCSWGEEVGIPRDDIAFLDLETISAVSEGSMSKEELQQVISDGRARQIRDRRIRLPSIIGSWDDCNVVRVPLGKPNFITSGSVAGPVVALSTDQAHPDIDGKIVAIESADPGFDWIFSHAILGLVTKFGGANSHMAIRCAEFELPAAIGCGERNFSMIVEAGRVEIDCVGETLRV